MTIPAALFPALLGEHWTALALPVRRMHGELTRVQAARGQADVTGATHAAARLLRRWLSLPPPGTAQALQVTIERHGRHETWTREFAGYRMRSRLSEATGGRLCESLGPLKLYFELHRDGHAIDWRLRGARLLGLPLPRACIGHVLSRSDAEGDRYTFLIDARLPLLGRLVAYHGWLEPCHE